MFRYELSSSKAVKLQPRASGLVSISLIELLANICFQLSPHVNLVVISLIVNPYSYR